MWAQQEREREEKEVIWKRREEGRKEKEVKDTKSTLVVGRDAILERLGEGREDYEGGRPLDVWAALRWVELHLAQQVGQHDEQLFSGQKKNFLIKIIWGEGGKYLSFCLFSPR